MIKWSELTNFMQNFSFMPTEWFVGLLAWMTTIYIQRKGQVEKINEDRKASEEKHQENNFRMKKEFRDTWKSIVWLPGESKDIFNKDMKEIQDENTKNSIYNLIDILHDVFLYHESRSENVNSTYWAGQYEHVFDVKKHKVMVSAFHKFKKRNKFSPEFVKYVEQIIEQSTKAPEEDEELKEVS